MPDSGNLPAVMNDALFRIGQVRDDQFNAFCMIPDRSFHNHLLATGRHLQSGTGNSDPFDQSLGHHATILHRDQLKFD